MSYPLEVDMLRESPVELPGRLTNGQEDTRHRNPDPDGMEVAACETKPIKALTDICAAS
jgi:hypothetical protein